MRARGSGNLKLSIANNRFDMFGSYSISEGDYRFTLRNLINKSFVIEKGGVITWNGDPADALINVKALYSVRPSLSDLMGDVGQNDASRRSIPVECVLHISNRLTNPNIRFEILMPPSEQEARSFLSAATKTEEEMSRQFLSLLIIRRFYPDPAIQSAGGSSGSFGFETMGLAAATEFLTNQLSYLLSQWSNSLDVDISYQPGMESQNLGVNLITDLWSFHMDYEMGGTKTVENSGNMVGDVTFDIKLNKSGKLRFKAFNRLNERFKVDQSPYTQGIGLLFREDFNSLKDLFNRNRTLPPAIRREEENSPIDENKDNIPVDENGLAKSATASIQKGEQNN